MTNTYTKSFFSFSRFLVFSFFRFFRSFRSFRFFVFFVLFVFSLNIELGDAVMLANLDILGNDFGVHLVLDDV
jgi:hypothetical protein